MEKKTVEAAVEADREINLIIEKAAIGHKFDLEAMEAAIRTAVLATGAKVLGRLLEGIGCGKREQPLQCHCGAVMQSKGIEEKTLLTIMGQTPYRRSRYECDDCGEVRYPGDEELDIVGTGRTPGLKRMMARAGSRQTFKEAKEDLKVYAGIEVSPKDVERVAERIGDQIETWQSAEREELLQIEDPLPTDKNIPVLYVEMDGTGVPMVKSETNGRKGKQPDGTAKTREVKIGCVFTQTTIDEKGRPVRDPESTTFVGAIETAEDFGKRIEAEAIRRGLFNAYKLVVLADGAAWIRGLCELRFPRALQIVDLYHSKEHIANLCKLLFGCNEKKIVRYRMKWWTYLEEGKVEKIVCQAQKRLPAQADTLQKVIAELHYLEENKDRMRYADFRKQGLFVGSGVIEASCKSIIGERLKQSGMEWTVKGANAIIALRCAMISDRFEDYWEARIA
jgi:hypothetical protein